MLNRRIISVIFVVCFVSMLCISPFEVSAHDNVYRDEYGSYAYEIVDGDKAVIVSVDDKVGVDTVVVPDYVDGYKVIAMTKNSCIFVDAERIKLPNTLEYLEERAIYNIPEVYLPENFSYFTPESVQGNQFRAYIVDENNKHFKSIDGVLYTKDGKILVSCPEGKHTEYSRYFLMPSGIEYIYDKAFMRTEHLGYITFSDTLKGIGNHAFWASGIEDLKLPDSLEFIDEHAFGFCQNLMPQNIHVPDTIKVVRQSAFDILIGYGEVIYFGGLAYRFKEPMPENHTEILKEGTRRIEEKCFANQENLVKVVIPASVDEIEFSAFDQCSALTEIEVDENNQTFSSVDGMLFSKDKTVLYVCPAGKSGRVAVPDNTEIIYDYAFEYCEKITQIDISDSVKEIGSYAFSNCTALKTLAIPDSVENTGYGLFENCTALEDLSLPKGVTWVNDIDVCYTKWYAEQPLGVIYLNTNALGYMGGMEENTCLEFNKGTTAIADMSFYGYEGITEVKLPESLVKIGDWAFENCTNLKSVTIPPSVKEIGEKAFGYTYSYNETTGEETENPINGFIVKGYTNSVAESYATEHGFQFVSIGEVSEDYMLGDTDRDNRLSVKDATTIQKYLAGIVEFSEQQKLNAEFNGDGEVNIKDATAIQKFLAGLPY